MQNNVVKAFRQRLVRGGFTDISIFERYDKSYSVYCTDREYNTIRAHLTLEQMECIPRIVWFDDYVLIDD